MKRILQLTVLSILFLTSCTKEKDLPTASFDFTLSQSQAPANVTITNTSTNALTYAWETSDGKTSTEANPVFTFNEGGTYEIKLTASNNDGSNSISKSVVIENRPVPVKLRILYLDFTTWEPGVWDPSGAPDVYFKIWSGDNLIYNGKQFVVNDIHMNHTWYFDPVIEAPANAPLTVELYDVDEEEDHVIRTLSYDFPNYTTYPSTFISWQSSVKVEIEVSWVY